ncbi:hypothetical protein [Sphingobacterium sp. IITKGP-BTPF85]|uniref:hypothetical protein n=1 Tax=Sphingobacterium sp. IITKGP-BTPF85 TaxID=1338009 RepID=UPI00038A3D08|nr:hypothetical protein [Sphingobacterium sp. IITKGP-BTPF85]KKX51837.1 hypothetical protein L950_0203370 [Sphingobacterium sp. IITKGP-BTPF85]
MEQRKDYVERQISTLGLLLNKLFSNGRFVNENLTEEDIFCNIDEIINLDLRNVMVTEALLSSFINSGMINRDDILKIITIMMMSVENGESSSKILDNILVMANYIQSDSEEYLFNIHIIIKKVKLILLTN